MRLRSIRASRALLARHMRRTRLRRKLADAASRERRPVDLRDLGNDVWMNAVRAQRVKGAPLSDLEMERLRSGQSWNGEPGSGQE